jgi:hypothetical protein
MMRMTEFQEEHRRDEAARDRMATEKPTCDNGIMKITTSLHLGLACALVSPSIVYAAPKERLNHKLISSTS